MVCKQKLTLIIILIFSLFIGNNIFAEEISTEEFIKELQDKGDLGFFDNPAIKVFEEACGPTLPNSLTRDMSTFCNIVQKSKACEAVEEKDKISCDDQNDNKDFDFTEFIAGCATGVADIGKELIEMAWSILKWVFEKSKSAGETVQEGAEYISSVKLYLITEYDKAKEEASHPLKGLKAAKAVLGTVGDVIFNAIQNYLYTEYKEFGCLNFKARTRTMCKILPELLIPPGAGILLLIKKGPKAIGKIGIVKSQKLKFALAKRKKLAEASLKRTDLSKELIDEIEKAHLVGEGLPGKNGKPAGVGNYTIGQLKEKYKILEKAGLPPEDIRRLMEDGVVGISSSGFGSLFSAAKLKPIGDRNFDRFRESFNNGAISGDDVYVSFMTGPGDRLAGQITGYTKKDILIQTIDGKEIRVSKDQLETVKFSNTSKDAFKAQAKEQKATAPKSTPTPANINSPRVVHTPISRRPLLAVSDDKAYNEFRVAYNKGEIKGDDRFVSIPYGNERIVASIDSILPDGGLVTSVVDADGLASQVVLDKKFLGEVRLSSLAKETYSKLPDVATPNANPAAQTNSYKFSGVKVNDYKSRSGETVEVNLDSPKLKVWASEATDIIEQRTGIKPNSGQKLTAAERDKVYKAWLEDVAPRIEDQSSNYADARDQIIKAGGQKADLGEIVDQRAAVCRELSICGSVLFNEYGIKNQVVTGNVYTDTPDFGGHAWIQVLGSDGKKLELIDSNNTRSVHPDLDDYKGATQGVEIIKELEVVR